MSKEKPSKAVLRGNRKPKRSKPKRAHKQDFKQGAPRFQVQCRRNPQLAFNNTWVRASVHFPQYQDNYHTRNREMRNVCKLIENTDRAHNGVKLWQTRVVELY